jgi:hypothetical protein
MLKTLDKATVTRPNAKNAHCPLGRLRVASKPLI